MGWRTKTGDLATHGAVIIALEHQKQALEGAVAGMFANKL